MSMPTVVVAERRAAIVDRLADYLELTKPKIAVMALVTVAVAAYVAGLEPPASWTLASALCGAALVAASASALNQWLERDRDALMERTAERPLPAGRLASRQVALFGWVTIVAGTLWLAVAVNSLTAVLGLLTWGIYVWIYTPLKTRTSANTAIGAVAGAMPVLMGWSAVAGRLDLQAFTLFLIVFLWQFPHFMAIAWLYRRQYAAAGMKMLPVVDPSGRRAGAQAMISALVLVPVSLLPAMLGLAGEFYFIWALVLGVGQLISATMFMLWLDEASARRLLRASLIYLSGVMFLLVLGPLV